MVTWRTTKKRKRGVSSEYIMSLRSFMKKKPDKKVGQFYGYSLFSIRVWCRPLCRLCSTIKYFLS